MERVHKAFSMTPDAIQSKKYAEIAAELPLKKSGTSLEAIMLQQMKGQFQGNIPQCVEDLHRQLRSMEGAKVRRLVLNVERNLNKFIREGRTPNQPLFQLHSQGFQDKIQPNIQKCPQFELFNTKLIPKQKAQNSRREMTPRSSNGELRRNFLQNARKSMAKVQLENSTQEGRERPDYLGKGKLRRLKSKTSLITFR